MNASQFIQKVKKECKENNIQFCLTPYKKVNLGKYRGSGYFSEGEKILKVSAGRDFKKWFPTLVHEYCHMRQWIENEPLDDAKLDAKWKSGYYAFQCWLNYDAQLSPQKLQRAFEISVQCERNCEQRSLRLIKKYNLPYSFEKFAQEANLHLYSYYVYLRYRKYIPYSWFEEDYKLLKMMPKHLRNQHHKKIPDNIWNEFERVINDRST